MTLPAPPPDRCPHCGQPGHWPVYERQELAAGRCPWSGLLMVRTEVVGGTHRFMCGVCDCFGYRPQDIGR